MDMSLDELASKSGKSPKLNGRASRMKKNSPYTTGRGRGSKRVYVGNLDWQVSWQDLKDHFRECGEVVYADVMTEGGQSGKGRSKGCGIVEFETPAEAQLAIETMGDTQIGEREIFVREDREDRDTKGSKGGRSKGSKGSSKGGGNSALYIGNIPWDISWQDLKDVLAECGSVEFADIPTGQDGRSRGYGLARMSSAGDARRAIKTLDGSDFNGRTLEVRFDRDESSGGSKGGGRKGGRGAYSGSTTVYVGNLSWNISWQDLKDHMRDAGEVSHAEIFTEGGAKGGRSKGCGIVEYFDARDANRAIQNLNDTELDGRLIFVREDRE